MLKRILLALLPLLSSACAATTPMPLAAATPDPLASQPPVLIRGALRDVAYEDTSGTRHTLDEQQGRFTVLAFVAHWCGICQTELPVLRQFAVAHPEASVVAVESTGASDQVVADFAKLVTPASNLGIYADPSRAAATIYLVSQYPTIYLIGPDGVVQEQQLGAVPLDYLETRLDLYTRLARLAAS